MINNLKSLVVIFISIFTFLNVNANEQFNFDDYRNRNIREWK